MSQPIDGNRPPFSVTALFQNRTEAEQARRDLIAAGYDESNILWVEHPERAAAIQPEHHTGFFEALLDVFVFLPGDDKINYAEAVRNGANGDRSVCP